MHKQKYYLYYHDMRMGSINNIISLFTQLQARPYYFLMPHYHLVISIMYLSCVAPSLFGHAKKVLSFIMNGGTVREWATKV